MRLTKKKDAFYNLPEMHPTLSDRKVACGL
jgi:hypothetical protein